MTTLSSFVAFEIKVTATKEEKLVVLQIAF